MEEIPSLALDIDNYITLSQVENLLANVLVVREYCLSFAPPSGEGGVTGSGAVGYGQRLGPTSKWQIVVRQGGRLGQRDRFS
jgi:hypothetical protein